MASSNYADDLRVSAYLLQHCAWPAVSGFVDGGTLVPIETRDDPTAATLDRDVGIDALHVLDGQVRGIASRFQFGEGAIQRTRGRPWDTFTVRYDRVNGTRTEYEKRLDQLRGINTGAIYPYYWIQGYSAAATGDLLSVAVACTEDLIEYLENGREGRDWKWQTVQNARFLSVTWEQYRRAGNWIRIWQRPMPADRPSRNR